MRKFFFSLMCRWCRTGGASWGCVISFVSLVQLIKMDDLAMKGIPIWSRLKLSAYQFFGNVVGQF